MRFASQSKKAMQRDVTTWKKEGAADPALASCSIVKTTTLNHHTILLIGVFDDYAPCCEQTSRYSLKMINHNNYSFFMNN
ncbi:MAG TPA: hypothetical protein DEF21_00425 [Thalassospira lucentensis]|uniref:Uncharacterized protein n=1 Tax=Thalassospira lucentensis TaxID=168935 RepID=A0A358HMX6_9PROT|nr:hypothetical protein [Thalassospira lucentensis]HCW65912.1 hypothetical protein [Thalassospira lucentensis]|tara:strand:- start:280 stop:519 length:240 start_codon:yes stop_codon:yes gene_type:complete